MLLQALGNLNSSPLEGGLNATPPETDNLSTRLQAQGVTVLPDEVLDRPLAGSVIRPRLGLQTDTADISPFAGRPLATEILIDRPIVRQSEVDAAQDRVDNFAPTRGTLKAAEADVSQLETVATVTGNAALKAEASEKREKIETKRKQLNRETRLKLQQLSAEVTKESDTAKQIRKIEARIKAAQKSAAEGDAEA